MKECGLSTDPPYLIVHNASREVHGGNVTWVIREFPKQLHACRQRHAAHANTRLIVVLWTVDPAGGKKGPSLAPAPKDPADALCYYYTFRFMTFATADLFPAAAQTLLKSGVRMYAMQGPTLGRAFARLARILRVGLINCSCRRW
jgi:hypothetical protein